VLRALLRTAGRPVAALSALAVAGLAVVTGALSAAAADVPVPTVTKQVQSTGAPVDALTVGPGETFTYRLTYNCSVAVCTGMVLTDVVPAELQVLDVTAASPDAAVQPYADSPGDPTTVTVQLGDVAPATGSSVDIVARFRDETPGTRGPVTNTVEVRTTDPNTGSPITRQDAADVTGVFPAVAAVTAEVTWGPSRTGQAGTDEVVVPGSPKGMRVAADNASNVDVSVLSLALPAAPSGPSPFDYFDLAATVPTIDWPDGADDVTLTLVDADGVTASATFGPGDTVAWPTGVALDQVVGLTAEFHGTFATTAADRTFGLDLELAQRSAVRGSGADIVPDGQSRTTVTAVVHGAVQGTDPSDPAGTLTGGQDSAPADVVLVAPDWLAQAEKSSSGTDLALGNGDTGTFTVTAKNASNHGVTTMTVQDPAAGATPGLLGGTVLDFAGFAVDPSTWPAQAGTTWPVWATGTIELAFADGGTQTVPVTDEDDLNDLGAALSGGRTLADVTGFTLTLGDGTAEVPQGAVLPLTYRVTDAPGAAQGDYTNTAVVTVASVDGATTVGSDTSDPASAQLGLIDPFLAVEAGKRLGADALYVADGRTVDAGLSATVVDGNVLPASLSVQDPVTPSAADPWWRVLEPVGIANTLVPAGSELRVEYTTDGTTWQEETTLPPGVADWTFGAGRDTWLGVRATLVRTDGTFFAVDQRMQVNLRFAVRPGAAGDTFVDGTELTNTVRATAQRGTATGTDDAEAALVGVGPFADGPGTLDKRLDAAVVEGSGADVTGTLSWGTGLAGGSLDQVTVGDYAPDPADPARETALDGSVSFWNAFDVVGVGRITSGPARQGDFAWDPYLVFDQVVGVEVYDRGTGAWRPADGAPCSVADPCAGQFPGFTLTPADRAVAIGVRLIYAERADRADVAADLVQDGTDWRTIVAPAVGSGVAAVQAGSTNVRELKVTARLRDTLRDDPAQPANDALTYNGTVPGQVVNDGWMSGTAGGSTVVANGPATVASDRDVTLQPLNLTPSAAKAWSRTDLGIPTTTDDPHPTTAVTVTGTNDSGTRVETLVLTEPAAVSDDPADTFSNLTITGIAAVTLPAGATDTVVRLRHAGAAGFDPTTYTPAQALLLTAADLQDVVQVQVEHTGRIADGAVAQLSLDTVLRSFNRVDVDALVTQRTIDNRAAVTLADPRVCTVDAGLEVADPCTPRTVTSYADAAVQLNPKGLQVATTKVVTPTAVDRDAGTPITATAQVRNIGNTPADELVLVDAAAVDGAVAPGVDGDVADAATFFNATDLTGVTVTSMPSSTGPGVTVRLDVLTGVTYAADPDAGVVGDGGVWHTGTPVAGAEDLALDLPDGVPDWSAVDGVRVTFASASGEKLTTPSASNAEIALHALLRETLRSDPGRQPSAAASGTVGGDASPNPGEPAVGQLTNRVTGYALAADTASPGFAFTSTTDTATEDTLVRAGELSVRVAKAVTNGTTFFPGRFAVFTLTFENTGAADVSDPVVTDYLPVSDGREQLVLDEATGSTAGTGDQPWTLTGDSSLDPDGGTLAYDPDTHRLAFTWPAGSLLRSGETGVITVPLRVADGAPQGVPIVNGFGLTSASRPLSAPACDGAFEPAGQLAATCSAAATIGVGQFDDLTARKGVRTDGTFVRASDPTQACTPGELGYSWTQDCVAVARPGGQVDWAARIVNTGNVPGDRLSFIDVLPVPGDEYLTDDGTGVHQQRQSAWRPLWDGTMPTLEFRREDGSLVAGAALDVYYAESSDVAVAPADYDTIDSAVWTPLTAAVDRDAVRALRFVVVLPAGERITPLSSALVQWSTVAPVDVPTATSAGPVAWNAFRYQVTTNRLRQIETSKVGVVAPQSTLTVTKQVDQGGLDPAYRTDRDYTVQVTCTVPTPGGPAPVTLPGGGTVTLTAADGYTAEVFPVPTGSSCTVSEPDARGASATTYTTGDPAATPATSPVPVLVDGTGADADTAVVVNTYAATALTVAKAVLGGSGIPADREYPVTLACTLDGDQLPLPAGDASFTLTDGARHTVEGLPVGASCTVTETGAHGAVVAYRVGGVVNSDEGEIVLASDAAANTVTVENAFSALHLDKRSSAEVVEAGDEYAYTLRVRNDGPAPTGDVRLVDPVPAELDVLSVDGPAPWSCTTAPTGSPDAAAGATVTCAYDGGDQLAPGASAPDVVVRVRVADGVAVDQVVNRATVHWTDTGSPDDDPVDRTDSDDAPVRVKWIAAELESVCVADVPWLHYTIDPHNVDTSALPVTLTWYADADGDGVPDGAAVHVDTIPAGGDLDGQVLWPGAAVDDDGVGIAWPGLRQARGDEAPLFEDQVYDPTLPEAALRDGALVRIGANPSLTVAQAYPSSTPDCQVARVVDLSVTKTASQQTVAPGGAVDWTLATRNAGYGATNRATLGDVVPAALRVTGVAVADPAEPDGPTWDCTLTGTGPGGTGGTVECALDGWIGPHAVLPSVVVHTIASGSGDVANVAEVRWDDPDGAAGAGSAQGKATVTVEVLASTGARSLSTLALLAVGLMGLGAVAVGAARRRLGG